jgi:hypothetical protein
MASSRQIATANMSGEASKGAELAVSGLLSLQIAQNKEQAHEIGPVLYIPFI